VRWMLPWVGSGVTILHTGITLSISRPQYLIPIICRLRRFVPCDGITDQSIAPCAKVGHSSPRRVIQERGRINYTLDDSSVVLIQFLPSVTYLMQVTTSCPWKR
jgi:hypothetical protein